jgi:hypothetical protein
VSSAELRDEEGRLLPGSCPGWGISWWLWEVGLLAGWRELPTSERFEVMSRYWRTVHEGWEPPVPREQWVGPWHPWHPQD